MRLSEKITNIKESGTIRFTPIIQKLRKKGNKIIDFAVGEPDFQTPIEITEKTKKALDQGRTKYSNVSGIPELKRAIIIKLEKENRLKYNEDNILIANGSKQALFNVFQTICNPDDEIIIPTPYWVTFPEQVKLADSKPVFVDCINNQLNIEKIKEAVNKKTKAIIINSPNNPTGAVYNKNDLKAIGELAIDKNFFIVSDEAYEIFLYDGLKHVSIGTLNDEIRRRTITVKSFSKTFSMTGFRIGYLAAEKEIIKNMSKLQGHSTGNVCTFAQYGAVGAFEISKKRIEKIVKVYEKRRNLAYKLTRRLFDCVKPQGAFYLFPNVENVFSKNIKNSEDLAAKFLEKAGVAVVPGNDFGANNNIRISYAVSEDNIKEGFEKLEGVI